MIHYLAGFVWNSDLMKRLGLVIEKKAWHKFPDILAGAYDEK